MNMNRICATILVCLCPLAYTLSAETNSVGTTKKRISREAFKASVKRVNLRKTGGICRKPNSAKGWCVILNAQTKVPVKEIEQAAATIDHDVHINIKTIKSAPISIENVRKAIEDADAQIGVAIVDNPVLPALLGAPEEGWGLVNIAKLMTDGYDDEKLAMRARREILRAFGLAAGAMYAAQGDFVLQPVLKPSDLDGLPREGYGAIMTRIFPLALPYYGISPWMQTTYRKAVESGWAPAPTNDYQKAIWDEIHAIPTKPIKIEFDPKTDRK